MSGAGLRAQCPAKVNLFLHVLGKRTDGYHEIRTLFQAIDLWDTLDAHRAPSLTLSCDDAAIPKGDDNLVLRAARLFVERTGAPEGAKFRLAKRIPAGDPSIRCGKSILSQTPSPQNSGLHTIPLIS